MSNHYVGAKGVNPKLMPDFSQFDPPPVASKSQQDRAREAAEECAKVLRGFFDDIRGGNDTPYESMEQIISEHYLAALQAQESAEVADWTTEERGFNCAVIHPLNLRFGSRDAADIVKAHNQAIAQLRADLERAQEQEALFRDLRCQTCGHHAHPDEQCGFCALARAKQEKESAATSISFVEWTEETVDRLLREHGNCEGVLAKQDIANAHNAELRAIINTSCPEEKLPQGF